jgi:uncharacterized protein YlxW (UPF0749 family)
MNPFAKQHSSRGAAVWIMATSLLVGYMASVAIDMRQKQQDGLAGLSPDIREGITTKTINAAKEYETLRAEVAKLREDNAKWQKAAAEGSTVSKDLNVNLEKANEFASLTEVEGPGVIVTLRDSEQRAEDSDAPLVDLIIHDVDIIRVVNELRNAGAEAVSINNRRIGPTSYVRCVGSTVDVDNVKFSAPLRIRAIGDPETLYNGLNIQGGIMEEFRQLDPKMADIEIVEMLRIPAYDGPTTFRFAKPVKKKEAAGE